MTPTKVFYELCNTGLLNIKWLFFSVSCMKCAPTLWLWVQTFCFAKLCLKFASALHDSWNTEKSNLSSLFFFSIRWCVWTSLTLCWTSSWWMPLKTWRAHPHLWWLCWGTAGSPTALKRRLINCTWTHCTILYTFCVANERTACFYFFKALATACWSVLKAKRRLLMVSWLAITCWKCCQASIYLTPQFVSLHRFPTASSPTSMPYQNM